MFAALATKNTKQYRGFDRDCDLYTNAKIGIFGRVNDETEEAWMDYINLLGVEPIMCSKENLSVMKRVIRLCDKNRNDLEIVLFTKDMNEPADVSASFIGYDVAGESYASVLSGAACCNIPKSCTLQLNSYGLFDTFEQATALAEYADSLDEPAIEPDYPYVPVKVYLL